MSSESLHPFFLGLLTSTAAILSFLTIAGNSLVLMAFHIERELHTISNIFLLSLAVADLLIGLVSMPLYTAILVLGRWPLPIFLCNPWLSLDYTLCNASAASLLIISVDRYFSITRPLTYRVKRSKSCAFGWIAFAWVVSVLIWTPLIYAWSDDGHTNFTINVSHPSTGENFSEEYSCSVAFLTYSPPTTIITASVAFYIPALILIILYARIYIETRKRRDRLVNFFSAAAASNVIEKSSAHNHTTSRGKKNRIFNISGGHKRELLSPHPSSTDGSSCSLTTPHRDARHESSKCSGSCYSGLLNVPSGSKWFEDSPSVLPRLNGNDITDSSCEFHPLLQVKRCESHDEETTPMTGGTTAEATIATLHSCNRGGEFAPSILSSLPYVEDDVDDEDTNKVPKPVEPSQAAPSTTGSTSPLVLTLLPPLRTIISSANPSMLFKQMRVNSTNSMSSKSDSKAAKTLSAILLAFLLTWTPYNVLVVADSFLKVVQNDIHWERIYGMAYWLCYLNSTVNPFLYATCNTTFRETFRQVLFCRCRRAARRHSRRVRKSNILRGVALFPSPLIMLPTGSQPQQQQHRVPSRAVSQQSSFRL